MFNYIELISKFKFSKVIYMFKCFNYKSKFVFKLSIIFLFNALKTLLIGNIKLTYIYLSENHKGDYRESNMKPNSLTVMNIDINCCSVVDKLFFQLYVTVQIWHLFPECMIVCLTMKIVVLRRCLMCPLIYKCRYFL